MTAVVAVDFGASSIRVCRVDLGVSPPALTVVRRHAHGPVPDGRGHLRWDWPRLVAEMEAGLVAACEAGPVASIGVDTWGVDYGLLDRHGALVAPPFSYRDGRTDGYRAVVDRVGERALYERTGIQLQPFNTLFQVAAHDRDELARARHLVMLPELLVHHLTGEVVAERTSAGTTALVDVATGGWAADLASAVGLDRALLPAIAPAGTRVGTWRGVPVHLVGGHDTASAVAAMGAAPGPGSAFVSAGTWLLVGREQPAPETGPAARRANFTNEAGVLGGVRFLKNLAGSWLVEGCRAAWGEPPLEDLLAEAEAVGGTAGAPAGGSGWRAFDVADPRFLHPADMLGEVTAAAGLPRDAPRSVVVRAVVESAAAGTAAVLSQLGGVTETYVFGGGSRSGLYRRCLATATGRPVHRGPVEATALGNALVQGIALGVYADLADARTHLAGSPPGGHPKMSVDAVERLQRIETKVRSDGRVRVVDLAAELAVSEMTIRRDLDLLAADGVVQRIRGGAVAVGPQPFADRFSRHVRAKDRIAAKLAGLVGDGGAIGIDASSTLQRLAGHVTGVRDLTVVTNGQDTFAALQDTPGVTPLLTGGQLDARTGSLVGPIATRSARSLLLRRLFLSAAALDPVHGTSETTLEDAETKLALADVAADVIVAVDSSKLGHRAAAHALAPDRVTLLVTELDPDDPRLDGYREAWTLA